MLVCSYARLPQPSHASLARSLAHLSHAASRGGPPVSLCYCPQARHSLCDGRGETVLAAEVGDDELVDGGGFLAGAVGATELRRAN